MTKYELVGKLMSLGASNKGNTPANKIKAKNKGVELLNEYLALNIPCVNKCATDIIDYIENDAEIMMPVDSMFNDDGTHITKKKYGLIMLKHLCEELRAHFC